MYRIFAIPWCQTTSSFVQLELFIAWSIPACTRKWSCQRCRNNQKIVLSTLFIMNRSIWNRNENFVDLDDVNLLSCNQFIVTLKCREKKSCLKKFNVRQNYRKIYDLKFVAFKFFYFGVWERWVCMYDGFCISWLILVNILNWTENGTNYYVYFE